MIICAKGFSQRIPEKNLRPFCGHPLVYWPILQGKVSRLVDEVVVSTQDDRIADIADELKAEVFWRQYQDTNETSGTIPFFEVKNNLIQKDLLHRDDIIVSAWAPNCILKPEDTDRLISTLIHLADETNGQCEAVSVRSEERTISVARKIGPNRIASFGNMTCVNMKSRINGGGFGDIGTLTINKSLCTAAFVRKWEHKAPPPYWRGGGGFYMPVEPWQMHDLDTVEEFEFGEIIMEHFILKGRGDKVYKDYAR